jgi:type III secretion protein T
VNVAMSGDPFSGTLALIHLGESAKSLLTLLAVCSLRGYVAMLVLPVTNDQVLQGVVRNGVALTIGIYIAAGQPLHLVDDVGSLALLALIAKEGLIGLLLGYAISTVFWVAEGVGVLIDNQAGYNNVQQTNPLSGEQSTPVGNLLSQLAICGFYLLGGMLVLVGLLFESFHWWPLGKLMPEWSQLLERFLQVQVSNYMQAVVKIASAVVVVLLLIDLGIGLIAKTADKLEPNNLGQPIKGAVAMLMLVMLVAVFFEQVKPQLALHSMARDLSSWLQPSSR